MYRRISREVITVAKTDTVTIKESTYAKVIPMGNKEQEAEESETERHG